MNMKKIAILPALTILCFAQTSNAVDYYWVSNWGSSYGKFSTPEEACKDALDDYNWRGIDPSKDPDGRGVESITNRFMTLYYPAKRYPYPYYLCGGTFNFIDPDRPSRVSKGISAAYRRGDECPPGTSHNDTTGECTNDRNKGDSCGIDKDSSPNKGNPINIAIGNKFQKEIDLKSGGNSYLTFWRAYNSLDGVWRHSYSTHLRVLPHSAAVVFADGRETFFEIQNGQITPVGTEVGSLTELTDGWLYKTTTNQQLTFNNQGKLTDIVSPQSHIQFAYSGTNVTVSDHLGNSAVITVRSDGQPLHVQAFGSEVDYSYDDDNRLVSVVYPDGTGRRYHYNESSHTSGADLPDALTGISEVDAVGNEVRYATYGYDDKGRAISSAHANGADLITLTFNDNGTTTVTNPLGKQSTYHFEEIHGVYKITQVEGHPAAGCAGANKAYTYDAHGFTTSKADWNGNLTTYTRDAKGREISRTEASGTPEAKTITTEWHPDFHLPVRITEPSKVTEFSYDTQGRLLSKQERSVQ